MNERIMEDKGKDRRVGGGAVDSPDRLLGEVRTGEIDGVREEE